MNKYKNKIMALIAVLKSRLKRHQDKRKDLELLVNKNAASPNQKQEYVELRAREDEAQTVLDLAEGLLDTDNTE